MKRTNIDEGINDKNLFKAVFLAGGPGSGKSFVVSKMFGVGSGDVSAFGVKIVNSDSLFELELKQAGLTTVFDKNKPEVYLKQMMLRDRAKVLSNNRQQMIINGMLPMIIDGTGKDLVKITKQARALKEIGYDVAMVFVNTSLEVSQQRNLERARKVSPDLVNSMWSGVQRNIGGFQTFFGSANFFIIDNSSYFSQGSPEAEAFTQGLFKTGKKLIEKPLVNPVGKAVLQILRSTGGKYLSDLG